MKHFGCKNCGNLIAMINNSGKTVSCCNKSMDEVVPKFDDSGKEKHAPQIHVENGTVRITVGPADNMHPMENEHGIAWVCLVTTGGTQRKMLLPNGKSEAIFHIGKDERVVSAFAYCNLHGLWVTECK